MSSGNGIGCCCVCLESWIATQPGTIPGYTPLGNWQKALNECCFTREYSRNAFTFDYKCEPGCVISQDVGGTMLYWHQLEASRGRRIQVTIGRNPFGIAPFPACDPDNDPDTAFAGCQNFVFSSYIDFATLYGALAMTQGSVNDFSCPAPLPWDGFGLVNCGTAQVIWHRISKPFAQIPSGTFTFNSQSVSTCYCNDPDPGCLLPCRSQRVVFDVTDQCVAYTKNRQCPFFPTGPQCLTPLPELIQYCFTPPTWSITF